MDPRLIITNVGYAASVLFTLGLGVFVLYKAPRRQVNIVFFLMSLAIAIFQISHVIGINTIDPEASRRVLMWNLVIIFLGIFICHYALIVSGRLQREKKTLIGIYVVGFALLFFYLLYPATFLLPSVPKMYLPNYYVPGSLHWVMRVYFILVSTYLTWHLIAAYRESKDFIEKNRIKYALVSIVYGSALGISAVLLIYNVPFDPMWSTFFSLYTIHMAYGIIQYELMDIRIIAKKAFYYGLLVIAGGIFVSLLNYSNNWLSLQNPNFPSWALPLFSSLVAVIIGISISNELRKNDVMKYEFINTVTHKFRTPLTQIKWASNELATANASSEDTKRDSIEEIQNANLRLVELTNLLVGLTDSENNQSAYRYEKTDLGALTEQILSHNKREVDKKSISASLQSGQNCFANIDVPKIKFVIQTLLENAIVYTGAGGKICMNVGKEKDRVIFKITDSGIGISKEELPYLFTKFYRGSEAKKAYTEGLGIGLSMAKIFIERHGGILKVASEGSGKGSTFSFALKTA